MSESMQARIAAALRAVTNPRTGRDVVSSEMIRDIGLAVDGRVRLTILLAAEDPASLVRTVRQALEAVEGVHDVRVDVKTHRRPSSRRPHRRRRRRRRADARCR